VTRAVPCRRHLCGGLCGDLARTVACGASESENRMRPGSQAGEMLRASLCAHAAVAASHAAPTTSTSTSAQRAGVSPLRVGAIALSLLCGLGAAGCGLSQQGLLMSEPNAAIAPMSLAVDSVPAGADAQVRDGSSCRTPCELHVTAMGPFMVDFVLKGYEPQSAEVILAAVNPEDVSAGIRLDPNPLTVELTAIPRPSAPARPKPVARPPTRSSSTTGSTTNSTASSTPSSASSPTSSSKPAPPWPEPGGFYWPQFPGR
jgi:hypothetical protein